MKKAILELIEKNPRGWTKLLKSEKKLLKSFMELTDPIIEFCDDKSFAIRRTVLLDNITEPPVCRVCGNYIKGTTKKKINGRAFTRFKKFCSIECQKSQKGKASIVDNRKNTVKERYGVDNIMELSEYKDKVEATMLKKYGVRNAAHSPEIRDKAKQTTLERYGVEHVMHSEEILEKVKETWLKKYGVENPMQSKDIINKFKDTLEKKYGVSSPADITSETRDKIKKTQRANHWAIFVKTMEAKFLKQLFSKEEYINFTEGDTCRYKCLSCGKEQENIIKVGTWLKAKDFFCLCSRYRSKQEKQIAAFLAEYEINYENNKICTEGATRHELDLYIPELNVGIEFHGLYWHSELHKSRNYHQEKYLFFKNLGIDIIQVFENEWADKQSIVKSILLSKLGKTQNRIFARKCELKEISYHDYSDFCDLNHIQGSAMAKERIGLYYKDELVQIVSFSKPRFNKDYDFEIIRSCTKLNTTVVGGFSKIFKYFINKFPSSSIITYTDVRYFNGKGYLSVGFEESSLSKPNYFYFKQNENILYNRTLFQKHKLKDKLEIFDPDKSEHDNMLNNKYLRIFDAGNLVLIYRGV